MFLQNYVFFRYYANFLSFKSNQSFRKREVGKVAA